MNLGTVTTWHPGLSSACGRIVQRWKTAPRGSDGNEKRGSNDSAAGTDRHRYPIDYTRGVQAALQFLNPRRATGTLRVSVMSATELIQGSRNLAEQRMIEWFLARMPAIAVNDAVSTRAYELMRTYFLSHGLLIVGALLAATALEHGLTLYTLNVRDFRMVPNLSLVRPY
jgi:predicted nucleic acid-binding protein